MLKEIRDSIVVFLTNKKTAYQFTFNPESIHSKAVLKDLAKFCRADETTFHIDSRVHCALEGRREVWLKIQNYLNLTPEELSELYRKE